MKIAVKMKIVYNILIFFDNKKNVLEALYPFGIIYKDYLDNFNESNIVFIFLQNTSQEERLNLTKTFYNDQYEQFLIDCRHLLCPEFEEYFGFKNNIIIYHIFY